MENFSNEMINEIFLQKLDTPEGIEKISQQGAAFVRSKLREVSFARQILPPFYVTKDDLTRSVNHDGLVYIQDIEPESKAMAVNFRGNPDGRYVMGQRYEIPLYMISSEDFEKREHELLAYNSPITEIIERNSVLDIQRIEDEKFLELVDAAIVAEGNAAHVSGTYESDGSIAKKYFKNLFDTLDGNELRSDIILMDLKMFNRLFLYDSTDVGDTVMSELYVGGHRYPTLFNRRIVVSNKSKKVADPTVNLLDNKIYTFTAPEFMGSFVVMDDVKFWIEKRKTLIRWAAYETLGMGIGNAKSVGKLTLV